jgi:hypothetical protein
MDIIKRLTNSANLGSLGVIHDNNCRYTHAMNASALVG